MSKQEVKVGVTLHNRFDFEIRILPKWYRLFPCLWWATMRKILDRLPWQPSWLWGTLGPPAMAENVVLNQALVRMANYFGTTATQQASFIGSGGGGGGKYDLGTAGNGFGSNIGLGSGTTAPDVTQTALVTPVFAVACPLGSGSANVTNANQLEGNIVHTVVIDAGQRIGDVYREVGMGCSLNGTAIRATCLSTRALITDGNDDPLTITKADLQVVTITSTIYVTISHGYGPNLLFQGTVTGALSAGSLNNLLMQALIAPAANTGYQGVNFLTTKISFGSDATIAQSDAQATTGVKTLITGGAQLAVTPTIDTVNYKVTYTAARLPSTASGTIREIAWITASNPYRAAASTIWRLVLPVGDNSPDYNNVVAASSITKNGTNVVDVSFVLQFGRV